MFKPSVKFALKLLQSSDVCGVQHTDFYKAFGARYFVKKDCRRFFHKLKGGRGGGVFSLTTDKAVVQRTNNP